MPGVVPAGSRTAAQVTVELDGSVKVGGRAYAEGQVPVGGLRAFPKDEVVVGELVIATQVQGTRVCLGDHEAEDVDPEPVGAVQVGNDQLCVGGSDDVGRHTGGRLVHHHIPSVPNLGTMGSSSATCTMRESV